ncbi:hypothetical protein QUA82_00795 [Microcoleus sp. F8-D3]
MDRTTSKGATPLNNVGFLGRCYNILKLNPLDLDGLTLAKLVQRPRKTLL